MFKKFFLMFILCMSILGSTVFADVLAPDNVSYKYFLSYKESGHFMHVYFNGYNYDSLNAKLYYTDGSYFVDGKFIQKVSYSGTDRLYLYSTNNVALSNVLPLKDADFSIDDGTIPPLKSPTVQKALGNLMTAFGANSLALLKIGVMLLGLMLGVSLTPRLVRLFL